MNVTFTFDRSTKNTHRYVEVNDNPIVGTLYVQKHALGDKAPASITVTITPGK